MLFKKLLPLTALCTLLMVSLPGLSQTDEKKSLLSNFAKPDASLLNRRTLGFGYDDAEAGFNGLYLNALYPYSQKINIVGESSILRGNGFNYSHTLVGATLNIPIPKKLPFTAVPRAGVLYSSFQSDSEIGILLGARAFSDIAGILTLEAGADLVTAGENSMVWVLGASYPFSDVLTLQAKYWLSDLDELTLSINYHF